MNYQSLSDTIFQITGRILSETELDAIIEASLQTAASGRKEVVRLSQGLNAEYLLKRLVVTGMRMREAQKNGMVSKLAVVRNQMKNEEAAFEAVIDLVAKAMRE